MERLSVGILAHVDAGKTTLSEAMLFASRSIRTLGRVDHGSAFLDTDALERERGITIFSKQALFEHGGRSFTLLDTPGHVDFSGEMERALEVMDCAVLVVSGTDGVQSHTRTLWKLLESRRVPVLIFVNKMDLPGLGATALLAQLRELFGTQCVDFGQPAKQLGEELALCSEAAMEHFLQTGTVPEQDIAEMVAARAVFPCYFGSALRLEGVDALLNGLVRCVPAPRWPGAFGARVFRIARDNAGARLTYLKVTGGALEAKELLTLRGPEGQSLGQEKADQLRLYSGAKFRVIEQAEAGVVCAATGLDHTWPGQGLGFEQNANAPSLTPVLAYQVFLDEGHMHAGLTALRELEQEDPQLCVEWDDGAQALRVHLMGQVQMEILTRILQDRYGLSARFGPGRIVYRETIAAPVEGVGHFEPLRHYAEVHLLLEPLARGSGLRFAARCPEEMLDKNWQRLVLTHLAERQHLGVLTGSPLTDIKITLVAGRAHIKHTEGGDFREATYRAVRQGLRSAKSVLLEPYYNFRLEVPAQQVGRAMADLQRMEARFDAPVTLGPDSVLLCGRAAVEAMADYAAQTAAYTKGRGRLYCTPGGYEPCRHPEQVIAAIGYDCDADTANTADSVFCARGAGYAVRWQQAPALMHVDSGLRFDTPQKDAPVSVTRSAAVPGTLEEDRELEAIFRRTYGPGKAQTPLLRRADAPVSAPLPSEMGPEYLLVDGYNVLFARDELKELARGNLDAARRALIDLLCSYQGYRQNRVIVVFDAYRVPGGGGEVEKHGGIHVVYTREAETADMYIEKATYQLSRASRVRVATSDRAEQMIILGHGTLRVSAAEFWQEIDVTRREITELIEKYTRETRRHF